MNDAQLFDECFAADFEAGTLTWRRRPMEHFSTARGHRSFNANNVGKIAGGPHKEGYIAITLNYQGHRRVVLAHRVLWVMAHGKYPPETIDHINCVRADNRLCNLREATYAQNNVNRRGRAGFLKGTSFCRRTGRYVAQISVNGRNLFLGRHLSEKEAHEAYMDKARAIYGEFATS
jgi:hypothetical protein